MPDAHTASRFEDGDLITGHGCYTADWRLPGLLHACFLRSDYPHARIVSLDLAAALACAGVVGVLTGADAIAAGYTQFPNMVSFAGRDGRDLLKPERPVLAQGKVRFAGEAVAMVVAESEAQARDALEAIAVEYEELPPVVGTANALNAGAPQLHDTVPGNLCIDWETGDAAAVAQAFAQAAHVTRLETLTSRVVHNPMEPRACIVGYDAVTDSYDIYAPSQGITTLRAQISALTSVPQERLRMHVRDVGGSFGQRSSVYPEHAALMIAAKRLRRPVKWVSTRSEGFLADTHGRAITMTSELALARDGRFLAARHDFVCDMGAYLTPFGAAVHMRNPTTCMTGVYRIPALYGRFRAVLTSTVPVSPYRGAGRPDMAYVVERLVDQAAAELGMDRVELRQRNFIPLDAFPYRTPTGSTYERADFAGCLEQALNAADWAGFETRRAAARAAGRLRGIGLASFVEGTSLGGFPKDQVAIEFDAAGRLLVHTVTLSQGQSHKTTFAQVVAQTLGVPPAAVEIRQCSPGQTLTGNHTGGSRTMVGAGSVCRLAALKLIEGGTALAAEALASEPSQIDYAQGVFRARDGSGTIALLDLARSLSDRQPHPLNVIAEASIGATFPNGCHVAEVEVDPETGVVRIVSYVAIDDGGNIVNHAVAEGQSHGGIVQGAGQVFGEHAAYDAASGQLLAGSFTDYCMPRAGVLRRVHVADRPLPSAVNALGAKGVGESGCTGSLPALVNATIDALRHLGIRALDMPLTPDRVWRTIRSAMESAPAPAAADTAAGVQDRGAPAAITGAAATFPSP